MSPPPTGRLFDGRADWGRRYPPLAVVGVALALALFALPSALNLPQANPGQTLEYAPVPGNGSQPNAGGNFAGLGLGNGGAGGALGDLNPLGLGFPPGLLPGQRLPSKYQCVGNPPRQTEDPLSPPCVPSFTGSNGCSTAQGVTCDQIRVLIYWEGVQQLASCDSQPTPSATYYNLDDPPQNGESCKVSYMRAWAKYFNSRYQTYNRRVHFWVYFSNDLQNGQPTFTPEMRRADAADNYNRVHPFAVIDEVPHNTDYDNAIAKMGIEDFIVEPFVPAATFQHYPGLLWAYAPSLEQQAQGLASYVCEKVIQPGKVTIAGSSFPTGSPRKYGLVLTTDTLAPTVRQFQDTVVGIMKNRCGFAPADTAYYPYDGPDNTTDSSDPGAAANYQTYPSTYMSRFSNQQISTVIWPGGTEYHFSRAAAQIKYFPEWVLGGDQTVADGDFPASQQDQTEWVNAIISTPLTHIGASGVAQTCDEAWQSVHPGDPALQRGIACDAYYSILRQLFTGIQVSGPALKAKTMDQGFHAIPAVRSSSIDVPACYYEPGDYTCIKDATAMWWDPNAPNATGTPPKGCWRMFEDGARYLKWAWPGGDAMAQWRVDDLCNFFQGSYNTLSIR